MEYKATLLRTLGLATFSAAAAVGGNAHAVQHAPVTAAASAAAPYRSATVDSVLIELLTNDDTRRAFLTNREELIANRDLDAASAEALRGIRAEDLEGRASGMSRPLPYPCNSYMCY